MQPVLQTAHIAMQRRRKHSVHHHRKKISRHGKLSLPPPPPPRSRPARALPERQRNPAHLAHALRPPEILIQIEDDLQRVPAAQVRQRGLGLAETDAGLDVAADGRALVLGAARHGQRLLQDLVRGEREAELGAGAQDAGGAALEEGAEALLGVDGAGAVSQRGVLGVALTGLDLQPGLDDVAGRGEVGGRHAGDGARGQELHDAELLVRAFAEEVPLQVVVRREVDGGEGHVAQQAGRRALVEPDQAEVLDNPHGGAAGDAFCGFGDFALDLEPDFDDFEGVGEDLWGG